MKQEEKYNQVVSFLKENGIAYVENREIHGVTLPLLIQKWMVVVHVGDNQEFYMKVRRNYKPVFIREEDSADFVLEKVQNTIIGAMKSEQEKLYGKRDKQ